MRKNISLRFRIYIKKKEKRRFKSYKSSIMKLKYMRKCLKNLINYQNYKSTTRWSVNIWTLYVWRMKRRIPKKLKIDSKEFSVIIILKHKNIRYISVKNRWLFKLLNLESRKDSKNKNSKMEMNNKDSQGNQVGQERNSIIHHKFSNKILFYF